MTVRCDLCGFVFEPGECPSSCPMAGHCKLACCPRCGYQMVTESTLVNLWRRLRQRGRRDARKAHR